MKLCQKEDYFYGACQSTCCLKGLSPPGIADACSTCDAASSLAEVKVAAEETCKDTSSFCWNDVDDEPWQNLSKFRGYCESEAYFTGACKATCCLKGLSPPGMEDACGACSPKSKVSGVKNSHTVP